MSDIFKIIIRALINSSCPYASCEDCNRMYRGYAHKIDPRCPQDAPLCHVFENARTDYRATHGLGEYDAQKEVVDKLIAAILKRYNDGEDLNLDVDQIVDMLSSL